MPVLRLRQGSCAGSATKGPGARTTRISSAIAAKSDFSPEKVAYFLLDPHPKMPNFPLNRTEAADIAAYIGSLRK